METSLPADDLLRRLGSGVRPDGASLAPGVEPVDEARFHALLDLASRGALRSGRSVVVAHDAQLSRPLHDDELERLAQAADAAEASGASRLAALLGERPLLLEVPDRRVVRELRRSETRVAPEDVFVGVDAAVAIAPHAQDAAHSAGEGQSEGDTAGAERQPARGGLSPLSVIDNPSVQEALAGTWSVGGSAG